MKLKIYSMAVTAFMGLIACSTANAQTPAEPVAPQAPATTNGYSGYSTYATPGMTYTAPSVYYYGAQQPGDTVYRNKMNKLREQMSALNKQMSELSREQSRKLTALNQERMATMRKTMSARFDSTFSRNLNRTFTNRSRYNFEDNTNIEKLLASGEVKEKSKVFTKSYPVDGNDKLQIDNSFGKITVNTWPKNEFKVEVQIKGYGNDEEGAQKMIDKVNIVSSKENGVASFKTVISEDEDSWSGTRVENGKIVKIRKTVISYIVYMPVKSALNIANKFGTTILPALDGKITINNQYGKLDAKALSNSDNIIHLKFVDANLTSLTGSDLKVEYGSLNLDAADRLNAKLSFTPVKIGKLTTSGVINVKYGDGLVIGDMGKNLKTLTVNSSFAPVKLGSLNDTNADFDVTVHNAEFMYNNNDVNITSKTPDNERGYTSTKTYKGHIGKGSADKVITINASYGGGVKFEK